jgi:peptidoglycan DL-endopeptidase CwlO
MHATRIGARTRALVATVALTTATLVLACGTPADAATPSAAARHAAIRRTEVSRVMAWAAREKGKPYRYGGAGPRSFDCSGLVAYVFEHALHRTLPHNAAAQYRVSEHISRRALRVGDLVFVKWDGSITHVGIYAGHGYWWVAPHTGSRVQKQKIYRATLLYGRIIR